MSIPPDPGRAGLPHTSEIIYRESLPDRAELGPACLLICDQVLLGSADPAVRNWIASFVAAYNVTWKNSSPSTCESSTSGTRTVFDDSPAANSSCSGRLPKSPGCHAAALEPSPLPPDT